jgi:hypothetical protein
MTDDTKLSTMVEKTNLILKDHNGVYLEKRLYAALKNEFPDLTRKTFQDVLNELLQGEYSLTHGLIRPESDKIHKNHDTDTKPGKGASKRQRRPEKKGI